MFYGGGLYREKSHLPVVILVMMEEGVLLVGFSLLGAKQCEVVILVMMEEGVL